LTEILIFDQKLFNSTSDKMPITFYWSTENVARWVDQLGYPQYKNCFLDNHIDGRKLILIDASKLPSVS